MATTKKPGEDTREFDTTALRANAHGQTVHRDYAAHFFRWGYVSRFIKTHKERVLDIGCGVDQPLVKVLSRKSWPAAYVGVDFNKLKPVSATKWVERIEGNFDFTKRWKELAAHGPFNYIVCMEVIEHMHKPDGLKLLKGARELLADNGIFFLSTPVYDGVHMANNHIHEYTIRELEESINKAGLVVLNRFGTFMSANDIKKIPDPSHKKVWKELAVYYDHEVLACFLAPLYPDLARNNLWLLGRKP